MSDASVLVTDGEGDQLTMVTLGPESSAPLAIL